MCLNKAVTSKHDHSRRDFFGKLAGRTLAGASILELAHHRAAWARALAPQSDPGLFRLEKLTDNVYFAQAHAQALVNSNAAIFVNDRDVLVVDTHSKPSASAALLAQIRKDITSKPVRYVVNTHFHWDHTQGNHTYREAAGGGPIDFIASDTTKQLMSELAEQRLKASLETVGPQIDSLQARAAKSSSSTEQNWYKEQISQLKAYHAELQHYHLELPTVTFGNSYVVRTKPHDLHVEFHGHAHTAGDVVVFCPQERVVATGDMILGTTPFIADGFPRAWPKTIASVQKLEFTHAMPGHGPAQHDRKVMTNLGNYIEMLSADVAAGKQSGKPLEALQGELTPKILSSIEQSGYAAYLMANMDHAIPDLDASARLREGVRTNIGDVYKNIDRV